MAEFESIRKKAGDLQKQLSGYYLTHEGSLLPDAVLDRLSQTIARFFSCDPRIVNESLRELKKSKFTKELMTTIGWRLCANVDLLKTGYPVIARSGITECCRAEAQILSIVPTRGHKLRIKFLILSGKFAMVTVSVDSETVDYMQKCVGFYGRKYVCGNPMKELVGTYIELELLEPALFPKIVKRCISNESIQAYNRKNILSYRGSFKTCPFGLFDCTKCTKPSKECEASFNID